MNIHLQGCTLEEPLLIDVFCVGSDTNCTIQKVSITQGTTLTQEQQQQALFLLCDCICADSCPPRAQSPSVIDVRPSEGDTWVSQTPPHRLFTFYRLYLGWRPRPPIPPLLMESQWHPSHYIILNIGILKSNSLICPWSEGYIKQYTPREEYGQWERWGKNYWNDC